MLKPSNVFEVIPIKIRTTKKRYNISECFCDDVTRPHNLYFTVMFHLPYIVVIAYNCYARGAEDEIIFKSLQFFAVCLSTSVSFYKCG